jgi:lambda family phage portal protein
VLEKLRHSIARWIAPGPKTAVRMYAAARQSRLTAGWNTANSSSDSELVSSLTTLRARSRALVRDAAYAKRAKVIVVNNVIGAGVGLQAQVMSSRDTLRENVNAAIEDAWAAWCRGSSCHTGGVMHFADLERAAMGQVFEAGEIFLRKHYRAFGDSRVPFALELIEPERLADEYQVGASDPGNTIRMGVEVDRFYRPVAYWIRERHPGELRVGLERSDRLERVPAEQIIHLRIVERWPQTRGEPWLHAAVRKLNDMDGYTEAEIVAARGAASYMATIESDEELAPNAELQTDGTAQVEISPGLVQHLKPGEKLNFVAPNRPNTALDPFMRAMLREVAAGCGVSYESLSRDYSQSNYSSSRLALLDDRDLWRTLQMWWVRNFRDIVHREWLRQAVLARAVPAIPVEEYAMDPAKFEAARFKPRGWSWIDPTKEVEAYKEAVRAGFITVSDVIATTGAGADIEDVLKQRRRELDLMAEAGLQFDTDPAVAAAENAAPEPPEPDEAEAETEAEESDASEDPPRRVFSLGGKR